MGHLINATAMRVGWFSNWSDSWFSEYVYYSEFLFMIFRVRLFLTYFFSSKRIESAAYFYSHFEVANKYNNLYINVYFYDGAVEGIMDDLFFQHYTEVTKLNSELREKKNYHSFDSWKILTVLNWTHSFFLYDWPTERVAYLIKAMNYLIKPQVMNYFSDNIFQTEARGSAARALFFYVLFSNIKTIVSRNFVKPTININIVLSRFIYVMPWGLWSYNLFLYFQLFLLFILEFLVTFTKIKLSFFSITGLSVNAKFLSRFIARKLKQNYSVTELLNPLKKELRYVGFITKYPLSYYFFSLTKNDFNKNQVLLYRKGVFKYLLSFLFSLYIKYYVIFFNNTHSWLFFDLISALNLINGYTNDITSICNSKIYTKNRSGYGVIFLNDTNYINKYFSGLIFLDSKIKFVKKFDFFNYIDGLTDDFYSNINNLFLSKNEYSFDLNFFSSNLYFNKFISYNYWLYNYNYIYSNINKRSLRNYSLGRFGSLIGFKIHCLGRFSRKQRASSTWFREIKVPLNTLSANIDYGFFTVPLKNSAVTVKVWLYKKNDFSNFYFKLI